MNKSIGKKNSEKCVKQNDNSLSILVSAVRVKCLADYCAVRLIFYYLAVGSLVVLTPTASVEAL